MVFAALYWKSMVIQAATQTQATQTHTHKLTHTSASYLTCFPPIFWLIVLQFNFPFVETQDVSAVKIQLQALAGWQEEESEEEESKTSPIIQSEGSTFPWNIDGELVEMANEVLIR